MEIDLLTQALNFIASIPEKDKFLMVMGVAPVLAVGFLLYEIKTKGFGNGK